MNYLRQKYASRGKRKSGGEMAFSRYDGEMTRFFRNELLATVFLWRAGRLKVREKGHFQE